ncbi:MAG: DUF6272 family protein [Bacteroidales bacterium]
MDQEFKKVYDIANANILLELDLPEDKNFMTSTKVFFDAVKNLDEKFGINEKLTKNLYFISSELVQAVVHNGYFDNNLFTNCVKISRHNGKFYLLSQNLAPNNKIERINLKFMEVNSCFDASDSKEELQLRYKYKLKNTPMTKRGVSVGVLDLARRSMNKLLYDFKPVNREYSIFTIICTVDEQEK